MVPGTIVTGMWRAPLPARAANLRELGRGLLAFSAEPDAAARFIADCGGSAIRLVERVVAAFPSFNDVATLDGRAVRFFKRAQILAADLHGAFAGDGLGRFDDLDRLTVFADYKAPQVLRGLGVGHLALAGSWFLPGREPWFVVVAVVLSLANGLGAGIVMTLGADLADPRHPAPFLGAWRFTNDTGGALAPLAVSGLTALVSLPFAVVVFGALGLVGALVLRIHLPRFVHR